MIKKIVIVGGGFAGWYTASSLQHNTECNILLIDSNKYPTIGVGETTGFSAGIDFSRLAGIADHEEFMRETGSIYKYGVRVVDFFHDHQSHQWGKFPNLKVSSLTNFYNKFEYPDFEEPGNHRDGDIGIVTSWLKINQGRNKSYKDFVLEVGELEHFLSNPLVPVTHDNRYIFNPSQGTSYNLDAEKTSAYLKSLVLKRNNGQFNWITNTVEQIILDDNNKNIDHLILEDGTKITADLFIDGSGLQRALMKSQLNDSWESQDQYCNAAWVVPSRYTDPEKEMLGISELFGEDWGWRFKVRLYHRVGNGYVFNTSQVDPSVPLQHLLEIVGDTKFVEPRLIKWNPGRYTCPWQGNLLPLGMAAEFVDPYDAPSFDSHGRALEDLIKIINGQPNNPQQVYNNARDATCGERKLRLDLTFGLSKRRGTFWDSRRALAKQGDYLAAIKDIVLGKRKDIEARMPWHWHHMYVKLCIIMEIDMSDWEFPTMTAEDESMAESFFAFNRARNNYISTQTWPMYSRWLQQNRFNMETTQEVLARLNPQLLK